MDYISSWLIINHCFFNRLLGSTLYLVSKRPFKLKWNAKVAKIQWSQLLIAILIFALSQLIVILWQVADSFTVIRTLKMTGLPFESAIKQKGVYDRGLPLFKWD